MFFFLFHSDTLHAFQKKIMYIYACDSLTLKGVPQIYSVIIISYKKNYGFDKLKVKIPVAYSYMMQFI